jgi:uncharacterized protein with HEPN domain
LNKDTSFYISHMVESIGLVEQFLKGTDKVAFMGNVEKQAAVVRMITILGEASKPVPNEIRERYPCPRILQGELGPRLDRRDGGARAIEASVNGDP